MAPRRRSSGSGGVLARPLGARAPATYAHVVIDRTEVDYPAALTDGGTPVARKKQESGAIPVLTP